MTTAKKAPQTPKPAAKPVAVEPAEALEAAVAAGKETVETVVKAGADAAQQGVDQAVAMGKEQVAAAAKAGSDVFKSYEDVLVFGKANVDAVMAANATFLKGLQMINAEVFGLAQGSIDKGAAATKVFFACKTPEDFFAAQNDFYKASYDDAVVEFKKISEMTVKVAEDSVAPITKQVMVAVETFTKPIAA